MTMPWFDRIYMLVAPEGTARRRLMERRRRFVDARRAVRATGSLTPAAFLDLLRADRGDSLGYCGTAETEEHTDWIRETEPTFLEACVRRHADHHVGAPTMSFLMDVRDTRVGMLAETLWSVKSQTSPRWEIVFIVSGMASQRALWWIRRQALMDRRVRSVRVDACSVRPDRLNRGLAEARGELVMVIDGGDLIATPTAELFTNVLEEFPDCEMAYADEDAIPGRSGCRHSPVLKPEWSPVLLLSRNYVGRPMAIRTAVVREDGGFRNECDGEEEWDVALRLSRVTDRVHRIPGFLYHRRCSRGAETRDGQAAPEHASVVCRMLREHLTRQGLKDASVEFAPDGRAHVKWAHSSPLVSIIIPTLDKPELIRRCVDGILRKTTYGNREIVIVDSGTTNRDTLAFYEGLEDNEDVRLVESKGPFSYSLACNRGAEASRGDILLFLNNDTEVTDPGWLDEMVRWAELREVGVVGAKLLYPDGTIQHAGVLGYSINIGHAFIREQEGVETPFGSDREYREYSGVTGACQMLRKSVFSELGGYDEAYELSHGDVALCLSARKMGYRVVYTPYARMVHHEGVTRGVVNPRTDAIRLVKYLTANRLEVDPFLHPFQDCSASLPSLRRPTDPSRREKMDSTTAAILRVKTEQEPLNIHDDTAMAQYLSASAGRLSDLSWRKDSIANSPHDAARFILDLLRRRSDLRNRFSAALSSGADGDYCRWLCSDAILEYGLPTGSAGAIREVFRRAPGTRIWSVYKLDSNLRWFHPLALTAAGSRHFLAWLLTNGRDEWELDDTDIWWFLIESAEDSARGLLHSYLLQPYWQKRFPDALTESGWQRYLTWLQQSFGIEDSLIKGLAFPATSQYTLVAQKARQLRSHAKEERRSEDQVAGVNVLGYFCYPTGQQQAAKATVKAMEHAGLLVSCRDIPVDRAINDVVRGEYLGQELFGTTVLHAQPGIPFQSWYARAGLALRPDTYRVGVWYWELDDIPVEWTYDAHLIQEVWAPTRFIAEAVKRRIELPVVEMLPSVELGEVPDLPREHFGLDPQKYMFLFMFDMGSVMERKNPLGLIESFKRAFPKANSAVLAIKVLRGESRPDDLARLMTASDREDIVVINEIMTREESYGLMKSCDCYVSLHRSEGMGLTMAEAMLMGKPVVATGYSGNVDFMNGGNSKLVGYDIVSLDRDLWVYKRGNCWAEPSVTEAAHWMRWAFDERDEAAEMAEKGRKHVSNVLSKDLYAQRLRMRLEAIDGQRIQGRGPGGEPQRS